MKFFQSREHSWDEKWNWVDENNIVLGFNASQRCCEDFGSYYHTDLDNPKGTEVTLREGDLESYRFDPAFHKTGVLEDLDEGGSFTVKMVDVSGKAKHSKLYLTIYNGHNGYYSHGFDFDNGETTIYSGYL